MSPAGRATGLRGAIGAARTRLRLLSEFRPYLRRHRSRLAAAIGLSIAYAALRMLEPWPLQILIDQAVLGKETRFLGLDPLALAGGDRHLLVLAAAAAVLVLAALSWAVYYAQSLLVAGVGQEIVRQLREDVFHQLQRLSLPFHRRAQTGDLLMRLTGDMVLLREMILASLVSLTTHTLMLGAAIVLMATVSPRLTLIAVVLAPLLYGIFRHFRSRMIDAARRQRRREGRLAGSLEEVLLAIPMIQSFTAEAREDERFRQISKKSARAGLKAARLEAGMQRMVELTIALGTALVLYAGTREVLDGTLTPGIFLVFLAYLRGMYKPLRGLSKVAERTARASAATERVLEILRAPRAIKNSRRAVVAGALSGGIRFEGVSFAYEDGTEALHRVDFAIEPGEQVALVGPTGAGKSTLFSLLLRFHDATEGKVRIDGVPIRRFTVESLRRQVAHLPQEPFLVGLSIRENLLYGRPGASDEELWSALRAVRMESFVRSVPGGLDAPIQSRGQSLSGGQKQRLAIARAILKDAPILLLDEPTTALDAVTERDVLESLERLRAGRTTLTIAHHLSTVRSADRVLVLDEGRLVEDAPPEELLGRRSLFRLFADIQGLDPQAPPSGPDSRGGPPPGPDGSPSGGGGARRREERSSRAVRDSRLLPGLEPDGEVRGVDRLLEDKGARRFARDLALQVPLEGPLVLEPVKQRNGQRALLRVAEEGTGRAWYAKLTRGDRSGAMNALASLAAEAGEVGVRVPRPVAWMPRFRALVLESVPGAPFPVDRVSHMSRAAAETFGTALADLHERLGPPAKLGHRTTEIERLQRPRERMARRRPDLLGEFDAASHSWGRRGDDLEVTRPVALHGDLHPGQVLVDASGSVPHIAILDWDEACAGEAERDIANFLAHLMLEAARKRSPEEAASTLGSTLQDAYSRRRPIRADHLAWYLEGSLLRLAALHADPDFGAAPPNPPSLSESLLFAASVAGRRGAVRPDAAALAPLRDPR